MVAITTRFILFAYSFVSCDYGEKKKHFYSNGHKDPMKQSVGEETLDMYKWRGWIGLINLIILFFMYFYILKMHAFQARIYYEKINMIYNSNSNILNEEEERQLEITYKQSIHSIKWNRIFFIFFYVSTVFILVSFTIEVILLEYYNFPDFYAYVYIITGIWYIVVNCFIMFVLGRTSSNFNKMLYEGNEKA